jgi:hypothetical protein
MPPTGPAATSCLSLMDAAMIGDAGPVVNSRDRAAKAPVLIY